MVLAVPRKGRHTRRTTTIATLAIGGLALTLVPLVATPTPALAAGAGCAANTLHLSVDKVDPGGSPLDGAAFSIESVDRSLLAGGANVSENPFNDAVIAAGEASAAATRALISARSDVEDATEAVDDFDRDALDSSSDAFAAAIEALSVAQANLAALSGVGTPEEIAEAEAAVESAQAEFDAAKGYFDALTEEIDALNSVLEAAIDALDTAQSASTEASKNDWETFLKSVDAAVRPMEFTVEGGETEVTVITGYKCSGGMSSTPFDLDLTETVAPPGFQKLIDSIPLPEPQPNPEIPTRMEASVTVVNHPVELTPPIVTQYEPEPEPEPPADISLVKKPLADTGSDPSTLLVGSAAAFLLGSAALATPYILRRRRG